MLWILALLLILSSTVAADDGTGFRIMNVDGTWYYRDGPKAGEPLRVGEFLSSGGMIEADLPRSKPFIPRLVIMDRYGNLDSTYDCGKPTSCTQPIRVPKPTTVEPNLGERVLKALGTLFDHPETFASPRSRAPRNVRLLLAEAVVIVQGDSTDLRSVFPNQAIGVFHLRLANFQTGNDFTIDCTVKPDSPVRIRSPQLVPGLFRVFVLNNAGEPLSAQAQAWVLLTTAELYPSQLQDFTRAQQLARSWGQPGTADLKQALLRATLMQLQ